MESKWSRGSSWAWTRTLTTRRIAFCDLKAMAKDHNNQTPMLEAVKILNSYGIEVVSGIIMGLDTDTYDTPDRILEFVESSKIPVLTINLLEALPRTPLHRRLQTEGRLIEEARRESN